MSSNDIGTKKVEQLRFKPSNENIFVQKKIKKQEIPIITQLNADGNKKQETINPSKNVSPSTTNQQYQKILRLSLEEELQIRNEDCKEKSKLIQELENKISSITEQKETQISSLKEQNARLKETAQNAIHKFNQKGKAEFMLKKQIKQLKQKLQKYVQNQEQQLLFKQIARKHKNQSNNTQSK